jgi:hypothetical protein
MPARLLIILLAGALLVGGGILVFLVSRPSEAPPATAVTPPEAPTPAPPPRPAPRPAAESARPTTTPASKTPAEPTAPTKGTLHVTADIPDATVFFDRVYLGAVPVTIPDITPGHHQLRVTATGYDGYMEEITVEPGTREIAISLKTVKLDERASVVHKHGIGSCRGTLTATPDGLKYETDNRDDAFSVPLSAIRVFEIDYLEVNLKVTLANGKTYNFTEVDGSADRLLAFHREVDRVRKRLASGGR